MVTGILPVRPLRSIPLNTGELRQVGGVQRELRSTTGTNTGHGVSMAWELKGATAKTGQGYMVTERLHIGA